jgi:non-ribosomal peptide synthetase component F
MMPAESSTTADPVSNDRADDGVFVFPASFAQLRLWLHDQIEPGRAAYNVPIGRRMRGVLDVSALERALSLIVERHEPLRTVFDAPEGQALQVVMPAAPVALDIVDLTHLPSGARESEALRVARAEANRPFDLRTGPVFRAVLVRLAADDHVLLLTAHHIAIDGWSIGILMRELTEAYNAFVAGEAPTLPELPIQYADYALWQRDALSGPALEGQIAYWREHLRGPLPRLELPLDRPRDPASARPARRLSVHVPAEVTATLLELCREERVTPFVLLLAAYFALLHRYTGDEDIIVASPASGRTRRETEGLIGFFVNTLAMRGDVSGDPTFRELLRRVRDVALGAMANQDLPFDRVVEIAAPRRDSGRMPIAQAMFAMQDMVTAREARMRGLAVQPFQPTLESAKFDVQMLLRTSPDGFRGTFDFDSDLFDVATAERFVRHYELLLGAVASTPDRHVSALALLDDEEHARIRAWSAAPADYPRNATVPELFDEWAARTPRAIALELGGTTMTYAQLREASERIAAHLRAAGVVPESLVAVALDRSFAAVAAMLGVLRAGAAYVPLDPDYPVERLSFMLADAGAGVVLTQERFAAQLSGALQAGVVAARPSVLDVDVCLRAAPRADAAAAETILPVAESPAYVIYTSGSTGQPKGVLVSHRAIVRLVRNTNFARLGPDEVMLGAAPISFDASTLEIWGALLNGGRLHGVAHGGTVQSGRGRRAGGVRGGTPDPGRR